MTLFFYGSNSYAISRQVDSMIWAYMAKGGTDMGLARVEGASIKRNELLAHMTAAPFLSSSRLVIVEGVAGNKTVGADMAAILAKVPDTTVAVFVEPQVDQRTKAFKTLMGADRVVKFDHLTGPKLTQWIKGEVQKLGGTIDQEAIDELMRRTGDDQWRIAQEVNKLANYDSTITSAQVALLVSATVEQSIFGLVESITMGRTGAALEAYQNLLRQREPEIKILVMIQWQLRNLLLAKLSLNLAPAELAKAAGMSPYVAGKMMSLQGGKQEASITRAYLMSAECEYSIKAGLAKADVAIERLIYRASRMLG